MNLNFDENERHVLRAALKMLLKQLEYRIKYANEHQSSRSQVAGWSDDHVSATVMLRLVEEAK